MKTSSITGFRQSGPACNAIAGVEANSWKRVSILTTMLAVFLLSTPVWAATIVVDEIDDDPTANNGACSLREAIIAANTDAAVDSCIAGSGADTITLPAGTYTLSIDGTGEDLAATGDLDINADLAINGDGAASTIIEGDGNDRVFHVAWGFTLEMNNVTITKGDVEGDGGGILNDGGTLMLTDTTVNGNAATDDGGGINNATGALTLTNSTISGNSSNRDGGGIYLRGTLTVDNSTITNNTATSNGGGIYTGAITTITLTDTTISGNTSTAGWAGGIFNGATMTLTGSTISGNSDSLGDGGITQQGTATITNSTISGNTGRGIRNASSDGVNSTFTNVTITSNTGSGYYHAQTATFTNSIIAKNGTDCTGTGGGGFTDAGWNLDSDNTCTFTDPTDLPGTDPLLGPLQDNGGATFTHALAINSPAIDTGDNAGCPATDQRGVARPQDGDDDSTATCDIGAYEFVLPPDIDVTDSVSPADDLQISFPETNTNAKSPPAIVTISNKGQLPLTVSNIGFNGIGSGEFTYDLEAGGTPCHGLAIVVNPGQHCTLSIVFSPHWEGDKSAFLTITSDDPDEATVNITLAGTGVKPPAEEPPADGGGCSLRSGAPFDPLMPLMLGLALIYLARSRGKRSAN